MVLVKYSKLFSNCKDLTENHGIRKSSDFNMLEKARKDGKTKAAFGKKIICDAIVGKY